MTPSGEMLVAHLRRQMKSVIAGRRWVVGADVLISAVNVAVTLRGLGSGDVLAIGCSRGTGDLPDREGITGIDLGLSFQGGLRETLHASERALEGLSPAIQARVDRFDPARKARAIGAIFCSGRPIARRTVFGARTASWRALEDKMVIDALWDAAGVPRGPSSVVPARFRDLVQAADALDRGHGTVWVGDNREGWHGGAELLRWVRTSQQAAAAHEFLARHCDRVRVMPFLEGIPCSIHGWVFPSQTIALRPCEMLVFRIPGSDTLSYAGASTLWEPPASIYEQMRRHALNVGEHLRATVGYRGSFTMDGIVTKDGFVPTELNPRFGGALARMAQSLPELPLYLLHLATAEGLELDYRPGALEEFIISTARANPVCRAMQMLPGRFDLEPQELPILRTKDGGWRPCEHGETVQATLRLGPATNGSILFATVKSGVLPLGASSAPPLCAALALADRLWELGLGDLTPAPDLSAHPA